MLTLTKMSSLNPDDKVVIVSPARPSPPEVFDRAVAMLAEYNLHAIVMPNARKQSYYLAGTDEERLADLHAAWADPTVKAIFCARGGYGCMRLLTALDWELIRANPKILIGFSDITALQMGLAAQAGQSSFYGPMLTLNLNPTKPCEDYSHANLFPLLFGEVALPHPIPNRDRAEYVCLQAGSGSVEAPLIGGNLSLLAGLCGTPYLPDTSGCILFIEDWHERFYTLDRKLQQLALAGVFDNLAGLLFCDMSELTPEPDCQPELDLQGLLHGLVKRLLPPHVPVGWGFSVGHGAQTATFPQGCQARFSATDGSITLLENMAL